MSELKAVLQPKRADVLSQYRHPWVFSKGVAKRPDAPAGSVVRVVSRDGRHLGMAFYHPRNAICLRMITFEADVIDADFWRARLEGALALRRAALPADCRAFRLLHGENDGFPGLTMDLFGEVLVLQSVCAGFEPIKAELAAMAMALTGAVATYERSDGAARKQEGLPPSVGFLHGERQFPVEIEEGGLRFEVDPAGGQKTGFFLDQRDQRAWVAARARNRSVLDLFCYSGGFSLAAASGGAREITAIDNSTAALAALERNAARNGLSPDAIQTQRQDLFAWLKQAPEPNTRADLVILDPPALAKSIHAAESARNAYRALNRDALRRVASGGLLLTFSCSGVIDAATFRRSVFLGLRDARREALLIDQFGAGPDHPVNLRFPEGEYLKGLALYLVD